MDLDRITEEHSSLIEDIKRRLSNAGVSFDRAIELAEKLEKDLEPLGYPPITFLLMAEDILTQSTVPMENIRLRKYIAKAEDEIEDPETWSELEVVRYQAESGFNGRYFLVAKDNEGRVYRRKFNDDYEKWFEDRRVFLASICEDEAELAELIDASEPDLKGRRFLAKIEQKQLNGSGRTIWAMVDFRRIPEPPEEEVEIPF